MNSLALNTEIHTRLRLVPTLALGVLPIGLMFASFIPLIYAADLISCNLGIQGDRAVIGQENGLLWLVTFLAIMVGLMVAGYALGWTCNACFAKVLFGWSQERVRRVFLHSDVPASWLKDTESGAGDVNASSESWAEVRKLGQFKFILHRGVFAWGVPMFLTMAVLPGFATGRIATASYFLSNAIIWGMAGALFGWATWFLSERSFAKDKEDKGR